VTSHSAALSGLTAGTLYHYRVKSRDAAGNLATSTNFTFTTAAANRAPIAQADSTTTQTGSSVTVNVLANDSDPDGDTLSIQSFTQPQHGAVAQVSGALRYTPTTGYTGSDSFTYTISDGRGGTATATVSLSIQPALPISVNVVNGRLVILGSSANDTVTITGVGTGTTGQYTVTTNLGTQTVSGVSSDIDIDLLDGDDQVVINNAFVNGSIDIDTANGNDSIQLGHSKIVSTRLALVVSAGEGNDAIDGKRLYIGGDQTIAGGGGDDQISFLGGVLPAEFVLGTSSGGRTTILGEAGADQLLITYAFVVGQWQLNGGADNDTVNVRYSASNGQVSLLGEAGVDSLIADANYVVATLSIIGGDDVDRLELRNSLGITTATLDGGNGNDTGVVSNLVAQRLYIYLGAQNDSLDIRSSLLDELFASLGNQDDSITLYGNLVRRGGTADGGSGADVLFDLGNTIFGGLRRLAFER
jgi:hypothetical protein